MRKIELDLTIPQYWAHKENGLTDDEIAELNFVSLIVVIRWKKENNVKGGLNTLQRRLTDEELERMRNCPAGYALARVRILQGDWDFEEALTAPKKWNKKYSDEEIRIMKNCVVGYKVAFHRLKRGWDFEKAITTPLLKGNGKQKGGVSA